MTAATSIVPARHELVQQRGDYRGLEMVVSPKEAMARVAELQALVKEVMVDGIHFGTIPGTQKPTLYQPGAQLLTEVYSLSTTYEDVETVQEWQRGFFFYRKRCTLRSRNDERFICDGLGSCNSRESKYAGRWVFDNEVPPHIDRARLKKREFTSKKGAHCVQFQVENEDIYSLVNTIEKMACKRALIMGVIGATRSAGVFSQDLEHIPDSAFGDTEDHGTWERVPREDVAPALKKQASAPKQAPTPRQTQDQIDQARPGPLDAAVRAAGEQLDAERAAPPPAKTAPAPAPAPVVTPQAPVTSASPAPAAAAPQAGNLTLEGVAAAISAAADKAALAATKKQLDAIADRKIGTVGERNTLVGAWVARRKELGL